MATDYVLTLKIDKVGDLEALNALNALDAKGRRIVEGVAGATGKALGDVAASYEKASKSVRSTLEEIAKAHEQNIALMQREAAAADKMALTSGAGLGRIRQGMTSLVAQLTGTLPVLDRVLGAFGGLAVGSLPLIGVLGGIAAITEGYKLLTSQAKEAAQQADAVADAFSRIAHMDLVSQAQEATKLYSGDKYAKDPLDRFGISGLRQQQAELEARVRSGTQSFRDPTSGMIRQVLSEDAAQAAQTLDKVKQKLDQIVPLYQSIMGPGGSFADASARQVASDQPGFITDALNQSAKDAKAAERAAKKLADAYQRALSHDMKDAFKLAVEQGVAGAEEHYGFTQSIITELVPSKKELDASIKEIGAQIAEAIRTDPFLAAQKAIKELAARVQQEFGHVMGEAMASAFETAFSGRGLKAAFGNLISAALSGLGGLMEAVGAQMIVYGTWVAKFIAHVATFDPIGQIEAGIGMIAAGALLKSIAGSFGRSGSAGGGGGYGGGSSGGSAGLAQIVDRGVINPGSYSSTSATSIQARPAVTVNATIIGKDDPNAQRQIAELINKASQRGWVGPAFA